MERLIENTMYAARWLLAPIYFGLAFALLALAIKFFQEIWHILPVVLSLSEGDLILKLLSLIDMALVGGLLVMVMLSGYENFVSQLNVDKGDEKLDWLGKMDSGSLKMKVAADFLDSPAADVHGCPAARKRTVDVVRDHSPDLRFLGLCHGLSGQTHQTLRGGSPGTLC